MRAEGSLRSIERYDKVVERQAIVLGRTEGQRLFSVKAGPATERARHGQNQVALREQVHVLNQVAVGQHPVQPLKVPRILRDVRRDDKTRPARLQQVDQPPHDGRIRLRRAKELSILIGCVIALADVNADDAFAPVPRGGDLLFDVGLDRFDRPEVVTDSVSVLVEQLVVAKLPAQQKANGGVLDFAEVVGLAESKSSAALYGQLTNVRVMRLSTCSRRRARAVTLLTRNAYSRPAGSDPSLPFGKRAARGRHRSHEVLSVIGKRDVSAATKPVFSRQRNQLTAQHQSIPELPAFAGDNERGH